MTSTWLLQYESYLMKQEDLELKSGEGFNPASVNSPEEGGQEETHDCIQAIDLQTWAREDLWDTSWPEGENVFIDGSSRVIEGKWFTGYTIINGRELKEGGTLLLIWSAQMAELYVFVRACELYQDKIVNAFTDSKYAYGVIHAFGKLWEERGLSTCRGKTLPHESLISCLLEVNLPKGVTIMHVKGTPGRVLRGGNR